MGIRHRKLLRDLWGARSRAMMMVLAIAASLVAVGAILSAQAIMKRETSRDYLSTNPASATIKLGGGLDASTLDAVRAYPGVVDATVRALVKGLVEVEGPRGNSWRPLLLWVIGENDPRRIVRFSLEKGSWPPPPDGLLMGRDALRLVQAAVGAPLRVKTPNGTVQPLKITGVVHDPSQAAARQEVRGCAYITPAALMRLGESPTLDELKLVVADGPGQKTASRSVAVIERTAREVATLLAAHGARVREIQIPPPYLHPHQRLMDTVMFLLLAFGVVALGLSGVLVANMLDGLLAQQVRQIGVLKAIGASTGHIFRLYLLMTLLIATAASLLAVAPSAELGRFLAERFLAMFGIDILSPVIPWWVFAVQLAAGLLTPSLLALVPMIRSSRISVREAINDYGVDPSAVGAGRLWRWLAGIRGLNRSFLFALRNMFRRRGRLLLSVSLLTIGGVIFMSFLNAVAGWRAWIDRVALSTLAYDLEVRLAHPESAAKMTSLVRQAPGVVHVEAWASEPMATARSGGFSITHTYPDQGHGSQWLNAVSPATSVIHLPVLKGRWLRPGDTNAVVFNQGAISRGYSIGDDITLTVAGRSSTWRVVGIVSEPFGPLTAFVTDQAFADVTGRTDNATLIRIVTASHDATTRRAVLDRVVSALGEASVSVSLASPVTRAGQVMEGHALVVMATQIAIALIMGIVGSIGLWSAMSMNVLERTRELGVMHAIGATPRAVRRIVVMEGVLTAVISCLLAILLSAPLTILIGSFIGRMAFPGAIIPLKASGPGLFAWFAIAILGAAIATAGPAIRASRLTVREAIACE